MERPVGKLVRDKIPEQILAGGGVPVVKVLRDSELLLAVKTKLTEEAVEVFKAETIEDVRRELGDLYEVADKIAQLMGIPKEDIDKARADKVRENGSFNGGFLFRIHKGRIMSKIEDGIENTIPQIVTTKELAFPTIEMLPERAI